jgi:hypothetical protein
VVLDLIQAARRAEHLQRTADHAEIEVIALRRERDELSHNLQVLLEATVEIKAERDELARRLEFVAEGRGKPWTDEDGLLPRGSYREGFDPRDRKSGPFLRKGDAAHGAPIHVLVGGRTLCGISSTPDEWPAGDRWVRDEDADLATCKRCREGYEVEP